MGESSSIPVGYSSDVRLWLTVADQMYPLAQIWHDHIIFRNAVELPPCEGEVLMTVDGRPRRWRVRLEDGAVPFEPTVRARFLD